LIPDKESLITRDYWWKRASLGLPAPEFQPVPALSALRQPSRPIDLALQQSLANRGVTTGEAPTPAQNSANGQPQAQAAASASSFYWENAQSGAGTDAFGNPIAPASTGGNPPATS